MKTIRILSFLAALLAAAAVQAQDIIVRHNGDSLEVKVAEVGTVEIKYRFLNEPDGPLYAIERNEIRSIRYQSGRVEYFEKSPIVPEPIAEQRVHAFKFDLLSPVFGYTKLSYEYAMKPGNSLEFTANLIGLGVDPGNYDDAYNRDAAGLGLSAGYKFIKQPDYYLPGMKMRHVMHGWYAKPTLHLGFYSENFEDFDNGNYVIQKRDVFYYGALVEMGKQWVFSNSFLLDFYFGLGLGGDNLDTEDAVSHWGITRFGNNGLGGMVNIGFKVGLLAGKGKPIPRPE